MFTPGWGGTGTAENTQGPRYRQASGRQRREDGAEQNKTKQNNTNINERTDNGKAMHLHNIEIKDRQQQECKMQWYENARVSYLQHKQHGSIALQNRYQY